MNFQTAELMFRKDRIRELAGDPDGLRYLKLRSLSRREYLDRLFQAAGARPPAGAVAGMFKGAYDTPAIDGPLIDRVIRNTYETERAGRRDREPELISQLYRLQAFDWGGLHQNSLEKTIVDNFVKKIANYEVLSEKIDGELHASLRGYVLCSWYNHWTSIVIEDVFRDHPHVLPAIGKTKKIDFFVHDVPFDLKVTYLPEGFVQDSRRADGLRPELTLLRQSSRRLGIHFDSGLPDARLLQDLWAKHRDHPSRQAQELVAQLGDYRSALLARSVRDASGLLRWLYENQGVRRFDASNRLFLVLVDRSNYFDSWKLKRAKPLLVERIHAYLDKLGNDPGRLVQFAWEGNMHTAVADAVFVVHPGGSE